MGKKLNMLVVAVAAFAAFAMPAAASAAPHLFEGESELGEEVSLLGTSKNAITTNTALGTLECESLTVNATTSEDNASTGIEAEGTAGETAECDAGEFPLTVTDPTLLSLETRGEDKGTLSLTFIADVGPFECHFQGTGGFTYETGTDVLSIAGITLASAELCEPEEGHSTFEGSFTITTSNGTPLTIKTEQPEWKKLSTYDMGEKVEHPAGSKNCFEARETTKGVTPPENLRWKPITC